MELYEVMRTTFSAREFTTEPLPDATLFKILDRARFAPSGGNRQGWAVLAVRDGKTREALAGLDLTDAERSAFLARDMQRINALGGYLHLVMSVPGMAVHVTHPERD